MSKSWVLAAVAAAFGVAGCASWHGGPARPVGILPKVVIPAGVNVSFAREGSSSPDEHAILVYQDGRLIQTIRLPNTFGPHQCLGAARADRTVELWGYNVTKGQARVLKLQSMSDGRYRTAQILEPVAAFEQVAMSALVGVPSSASADCKMPG